MQQPPESNYQQPYYQPPQQPYTPPPQIYPNTSYQPQQPYYPPQYTPPPGYPPQQPYYPPQPPTQPPKKSKTGLWVGIGVVVLVFFLCIAAASHGGNSSSSTTTTANTSSTSNTSQSQPTQIPTQAPAKSQTWTTTQKFSGNGEKKTAVFSVPDDWKIEWTCNPSSFGGMSYNVIVAVYNSDGTIADYGAINAMCKTGTTSGETEEHQSGNVYLDITSEGDWTVTVQQLK